MNQKKVIKLNKLNKLESKENEESDIADNISEQYDKEQKILEEYFDPEDLIDNFRTEYDLEIVNKDIPERLQLRYENYTVENNNYFEEESLWLAENIVYINNLSYKEVGIIQKKVLKILELIRIGNFELIYIWQHRKHEIYSEKGAQYDLKLEDFWYIYDNDLLWSSIYKFKNYLRVMFSNLEGFEKLDNEIFKSFEKVYDLEKMKYYEDFILFRLKLYLNESQIAEKINEVKSFYYNLNEEELKKTIKKNNILELNKRNMIEDIDKFSLKPSDLYENLIKQSQVNTPKIDTEIDPEGFCAKFIADDFFLLRNSQIMLQFIIEYKAQEYNNYPLLKNYLRTIYEDKLLITTEPTILGEKEINIYSNFYPAKRIINLKAIDIAPELWFLCKQAEQKKLIKIKFELPWKKENKRDELKNILMESLCNKIKKNKFDMSISNEDMIKSWNLLREKVIDKFLTKYFYPEMEKKTIENITNLSEEIIIKKCVKNFKELVNIKPYKKINDHITIEDSSNLDNIKNELLQYQIKVISIIISDTDNKKSVFGFVNEDGVLIDSLSLGNISKKYINNDKTKTFLYEKDKEKLTDFIKRNFPDVIVLKANNLSAYNLKHDIGVIVQEIFDEIKDNYNIFSPPFILYSLNDVSELISKCCYNNNIKDSEDINEAVSMARYIQNPLSETLRLWNRKTENNYLLYLNFHEFKDFVNKNILKNEIEKVIIEIVNHVGVDINKCIKYDHHYNLLQFITGLGPRKAFYLKNEIVEKLGDIRNRAELKEAFLGPNVFINSIATIKLTNILFEDITNDNYNYLDATRIHPDFYKLVEKLASETKENDTTSNNFEIKNIINKPKKLKELDLEDFANHLSEKKKTNMNILIEKIINEISTPYNDDREYFKTKYNIIDLFYKITSLNKYIFMTESIVNCKIIKIEQKSVKIMVESSVPGYVNFSDLKERSYDLKEEDIYAYFKIGEYYLGRIKQIEYDKFKIKCSFRPEDLMNHKDYIKKNEILSKYNLIEGVNFIQIKEKDFPIVLQTETKKISKYIPRKINHPKFKNIAYGGCLEYLKDKQIGDFLFRPSSKGTDNLNLTWKFYEGVFVNLDIKEGYKNIDDKISGILKLDKEEYSSLDEIIHRYVIPVNLLLKKCMEDNKFFEGKVEQIYEMLIDDKDDNNNKIPYYFFVTKEMPQYVILAYIINLNDPIFEPIKLKPDGYFFHSQKFSNFSNLIKYFKSKVKSVEYQKYVESMPNINILKTNYSIKKEEIKHKHEYIKEEYNANNLHHKKEYNAPKIKREYNDNDYRYHSRKRSYSNDEDYNNIKVKKEYYN